MTHDWAQTASLMALNANCHRNPEVRRQPYRAHDFAPWLPKPERTESAHRVSIDALKVFLPPSERDGQVLKID